jgi:hypothetical protein
LIFGDLSEEQIMCKNSHARGKRPIMRTVQTFSVAAALLAILTASVHAGALSLDQEADSEAQQYFARALTKCGDKHVSARKELLLKTDVIDEYLEASMKVLPSRVTDANRLKGIEWQGMFTVSAKAQRSFSRGPGQPQPSWSLWMDGGGFSTFVKKQAGQWIIDDAQQHKAIDCAHLPQ